ncbi:MAG TPA: TfoX/Sxy family protein [Spirochaetia bacterium]|nr:TfoX/Sxy family protein [Spirochaetia bacterium]
MKWKKAPDDLKLLIENLMQGVDCQERPMFGYPAFFINRNMFAGLFQDQLFLRLSPEQQSSLRTASPGIANLQPMPGRPMKDYFVIPRELYGNEKAIRKIIAEAAFYCRTLPPKPQKSRKPRKT